MVDTSCVVGLQYCTSLCAFDVDLVALFVWESLVHRKCNRVDALEVESLHIGPLLGDVLQSSLHNSNYVFSAVLLRH